MNKTRLLAVPAIAAVSLLALTGCFQLPSVGGTSASDDPDTGTTSAPEESTGGESGGEESTGGDLAGTTWTGGELGPGFATLDFTLNADGTVDITTWNDGSGFDSPSDTWSGDASSLTILITQLTEQGSDSEPFDVTFTGTVEGGEMNLTGHAPDGDWTLTATQG